MSVHPTAILSPGATLGRGVVLGPYSVVEDQVVIGEGSEIRAHAVVKRFTHLGADNTVHEGAILGGEPQDVAFAGGETHLRIGDGNRIREGVTLHRSTAPGGTTVVGSECFLMAYAHVAHDDRIGDRVILANNVALAGHVEIADRAFLSGGVVVHQFCRIGRLAMIGGNAKIVQDCLPFVIGPAQVRALKEAYRLLLRSSLPREAALERMAALEDPLVEEMISFVRSSRRGIAGEGRDTG
jgi:UDP-N-acetylglucosamine acyltransferase